MPFSSRPRLASAGIAILLLFASVARAQSAPPPAGTGGYVTVNGARLFHTIVGQGEPLLIIPGGPGDPHNGLAAALSPMAGSARLIFFDAFGRGRSDRAKSATEYSFSRDVEDVEGLRVALGLGPINVLGHSYGGIVAQAYALKYPTSVRRLILSSTFHSAEMWQDGNNDTSNFEIKNQYPEIWARLQELRRNGRLSSDPEYQTIQGGVSRSLLYY
jgi:proline iminopeptidase